MMGDKTLAIAIVEDGLDINTIFEKFPEKRSVLTDVFSTSDEITPVITEQGFGLSFRVQEFMKIEWVENLVKILSTSFNEQLPGVVLDVQVQLIGEGPDYNPELVNKLKILSAIIRTGGECNNLLLHEDDDDDDEDDDWDDPEWEDMTEDYWDDDEVYADESADDDGEGESTDDEDCDDEPETGDYIYRERPTSGASLASRLIDEEDQDEDDEDDPFLRNLTAFGYSVNPEFDSDKKKNREGRKKKKMDGKSYNRSRVIREAKHAKRSIKRHNIIIASKKSIEKDKKILKQFLEDFMPGKEKWVKEYRKEVLRRWMRSYVIKKGEAKRISQEYEEKRRKSIAKKKVNRVNEIANALINNSAFYDPTK